MAQTRRWMNCELKRGVISDSYKEFLHEHNIKFEASGCGYELIHFEVFCNDHENELCNRQIDWLYSVWNCDEYDYEGDIV